MKRLFLVKTVFVIALFLGQNTLFPQDQKIADSLAIVFEQESLSVTERLDILVELSHNENNRPKAAEYAEQLIALASEHNSIEHLQQGHLQLGNAYKDLAQFDLALENYFTFLNYVMAEEDPGKLGAAYMSIADIYALSEDHPNADLFYERAINSLRKSDDRLTLAKTLANTGDGYVARELYAKAKPLLEESIPIFEELRYDLGLAYAKGNLGIVYAVEGDDKAQEVFNGAINILKEKEDDYGLSAFLNLMANVYLGQGNTEQALEYANESLALAVSNGYKKEQSDANLILSKIHEQRGDDNASLAHYKQYVAYLDNLKIQEQDMAKLRREHDLAQTQAENEILSQKQRTNKIITISIVGALIVLAIFIVGLFRRFKFIQRTKKIIEEEKNRSKNLLENILPAKTADELMARGKVQAQRFESVSVMFTDFQGFTKQSEQLSPEELVQSVDYYFSQFDAIIQKYGLEKIKTIGDSYMCAGGLPFPLEDHAEKAVKAAMEIIAFVENTRNDPQLPLTNFEVRIGIHSGPLIAGVVGTKKFAYDIWGDTVNVAARMETMSEPGKINISEHTHGLIGEHFNCTYRGEIDVKYKGKLKMYFVEGTARPKSKPITRKRKKQLGQEKIS